MIRLSLALLFVLSATGSAAPNALPAVDLEVVGGDANANLVTERVASWFQGTKLSAQHLTSLDPNAVLAKPDHPGVQIWIVVLEPKHARLFFAVEVDLTTSPRYLMLDVPLDNGLDELGIEQLAQVVFPSANALWLGEMETSRADVERELMKVTAATTPPAATPHSTMHLSLGPEYQALAEGSGISQSIGGTATILGHRLGLRARFAAQLPRDASDDGVTVELRGMSAGAGGVLSHPVAQHVRLLAELGAGIDIVSYRPTMLPDPVRPATGGTDIQPLLYARAGAGVSVGSFWLVIEAVANVHLRRTHYDVTIDGQSNERVVPWLLQPGIAATLTW